MHFCNSDMSRKKRLLVISTIANLPVNSGNRARIDNLCQMATELGFEVHYLWVRQMFEVPSNQLLSYWGDRITVLRNGSESLSQQVMAAIRHYAPRSLREWIGSLKKQFRSPRSATSEGNSSLPIDAWYPQTLEASIRTLIERKEPDVVMVEYVFLSKILDLVPSSTLKVIDTHDVFADRASRVPGWFSTSESEECRGLRRADRILAISDSDAGYFRKRIDAETCVVGHLMRPCPLPLRRSLDPISIGCFGSDYRPNIEGFEWFIQEVLPLLETKGIRFELIVGGGMSRNLRIGEIEGVRCQKGGDPKEFFLNVDIVIDPVQTGTGLSIKLLEALAYNRPVVAGLHGKQGIPGGAGNAFLFADEPGVFAQHISDLALSPEMRDDYALRGHDYYRRYFESMRDNLAKVLR